MTTEVEAKKQGSFFLNAGTNNGHLTTPEGDRYVVPKMTVFKVKNPHSGAEEEIIGGYVVAEDRSLEAADNKLKAEFDRSGKRPEDFHPQSTLIPLYLTLRQRDGKNYTDIGTLWTSKGRITVLARDQKGKRGLRLAGDTLPFKTDEQIAAEKAARAAAAASQPDAEAARDGAARRARKTSEPKAPAAEKA